MQIEKGLINDPLLQKDPENFALQLLSILR